MSKTRIFGDGMPRPISWRTVNGQLVVYAEHDGRMLSLVETTDLPMPKPAERAYTGKHEMGCHHG